MKVEIQVKLKILPGSKNFILKNKHYDQLRSLLSGVICRMNPSKTFKKGGQIQRHDAYCFLVDGTQKPHLPSF